MNVGSIHHEVFGKAPRTFTCVIDLTIQANSLTNVLEI